MAKVISKSLFFFVVVFFLLPRIATSQFNPHSIHKNVIGTSNSSTIKSAAPPKVLAHPEIGNFQIQSVPLGVDAYSYMYTPGISEGYTNAVIEYYRRNESTGELYPAYTTIYFKIAASFISCTDDFFSVEMNSAQVSVDVIANDSRTDGPLILDGFLYSENGTASVSGNEVVFQPDADFAGDAFIYYSVIDQLGKSATGLLKVKVVDPTDLPSKLNLNYLSYGGEAVDLDLPYDGFSAGGNLQFGTFKSVDGKQTYEPYGNVNSKETFQLQKGSLSRFVTVEVVHKQKASTWVRDDVRYTAKGIPLDIDVQANDLKEAQSIINHSSSLVETPENGVFSYTPEYYFSGTKAMTYTASDGYSAETGKVLVHVSNFYPQTKYKYDFMTLGNSPLVINYEIPLGEFSFELVGPAQNGSVAINEGSSTMTFECDEISGRNLIIYEPDHNYLGDDEFTVRYCVEGNCRNIKIKVEVVQDDGASCRCYTGCVWSGDANADGVVNAADLLSLAYAFGESGDGGSMSAELPWQGRKVNDWNFTSFNGINAKYSDSDGSGTIDEADLLAIEENYNLNHDLVPPQFVGKKDFPFNLNIENDTVYVGDLIEFQLGIGNSVYPAIDVSGFSYSLGFPPSFVDSASLKVDYYSNSWFGIDERVLGVTKQIRTGWIESAASRVGAQASSGAGNIGKASFIVEEDVVGGFRVKDDGIIPMTIRATDIKVMTSNGELSQLEDAELTIYVDIRSRSIDEETSELLVFPNPAQGILNLHMNGGHDILSYEIYNVNGQQLLAVSNLKTREQKISLDGMSQGVYFIKALTSSGLRIDRFEVIK